MIPRVIHYCWFGKNPLPEDAMKCIASWKKYCPDYQIIQWNEDNYDVNRNQYVSAAYKEKKWAFVSDYARIDIINEYGGIYMDTDVELIKSLDGFLNQKMFCGWEERDAYYIKRNPNYENSVNTGLGFGAEAKNPILIDILEFYNKLSFYNGDGSLNLIACPHYQTQIMKKYGLDDTKRTYQKLEFCTVYPEDYFSPKSITTGKINLTKNTVSIHHFSMSWIDPYEKKMQNMELKLQKYVSYRLARFMVKCISIPFKIKRKIKSAQ